MAQGLRSHRGGELLAETEGMESVGVEVAVEKVEDAIKHLTGTMAENAKTQGETIKDDVKEALLEAFTEMTIRTISEGGLLDGVGATGTQDIDSYMEVARSTMQGDHKSNKHFKRAMSRKIAMQRRVLGSEVNKEIDKYQDETPEREERKLAALEDMAKGGSGGSGSLTKTILGVLLGAAPGLFALYHKLTGDGTNLNQTYSLGKAALDGAKLGYKMVSKPVKGTIGFAKNIAKGAWNGVRGKGFSTGADIMDDIVIDTMGGGAKAGDTAKHWVKSSIMWIINKCKKFLPAKWLVALEQGLPKLIGPIQKKLAKVLTDPKVMKATNLTKNIPFLNIGFAIWDVISGYRNAAEYLKLEENQVTVGMKVATGLANGLLSIFAAVISTCVTTGTGGLALGASMIINIIMGMIPPGWLARFIYDTVSVGGSLDEEANKQAHKQKNKQEQLDKGKEENPVYASSKEKSEMNKDLSEARKINDKQRQDRNTGVNQNNSAFSRMKEFFGNAFSSSGSSSTSFSPQLADLSIIGGYPVQGGRVSSPYGMRTDPFTGQGTKMHDGIDFAVPVMTPVYASCDGVVELAGVSGKAGLRLVIKGDNGYYFKYFHLSEIIDKFNKVGARVRFGEHIAYSGGAADGGANAGSSTGPHLHYEIRQGQPMGPSIDPQKYHKTPVEDEPKQNVAQNEQQAKNISSINRTNINKSNMNTNGYGVGDASGISKEAEAALIALPGLLAKLIEVTSANKPKEDKGSTDKPVDFDGLLNSMRSVSSVGNPGIG